MVCVWVQGGAQRPVSEGEDAEEGRTGGGQEGQADGAAKGLCGSRGTQEVILINNTCWYSFGGLWGGVGWWVLLLLLLIGRLFCLCCCLSWSLGFEGQDKFSSPLRPLCLVGTVRVAGC